MISWLKRLTKAQQTKAVIPSSTALHQADEDPLADIPRYPPFDTGIPVVQPEAIVRSQKELIARIYRTAGMSREEFSERIEPVIENLARYVHLLPATATTYHRGAGGLFRLALEVGLHSMQSANAAVFPVSGGVERRYYLQPKWSLATFFAGICSQLHRPINNLAVFTRSNEQWPPLLKPLYEWALTVNAENYFIRWREERTSPGAQSSAAFIVNQIIPPEVLHYLSADNNQVIQAMTSAITGTDFNASENPIARLIAPITTRVIEEDLKRSAMNYGNLSIGFHLEPHVIDAMRRLVKSGEWTINNDRAALWIGAEGTFIDWGGRASDVVNLMTRDSFVGVPKDLDTLADMLCEAGIFSKHAASRYWTIAIPETGELKDSCVKLTPKDLILPSHFDFQPYATVTLMLSKTQSKGTKPSNPDHGSTDSSKRRTEEGVTDIAPVELEIKASAIETSSGDGSQETPARNSKKKAKTHDAGLPPEVGPPKHDQEQKTEPEHGGEVTRVQGAGSEKLLAGLKKDNAWLLKQLIDAINQRKTKGKVAWLQNGLVISHEELIAHGQNPVELLEEMRLKQWLWSDKTKPMRKIHSVDIDGQKVSGVVIRPEIAQALGIEGA